MLVGNCFADVFWQHKYFYRNNWGRNEEILNYIRVLFSDKQVVETYQKLIFEGYSWQHEYANFGSMVDEKRESFHGQVQIVMEKDKGAKRNKVGKRWVLVIDFLWGRIGNRIEDIKVETYSQ